ncbi:hypothetical protein E2C01_058380 [Portunus trituberculatus]|uniref:Uncharacterized protein n=1 Tax=Portunus trituberculatus TaxID=210409 RepID=A0A5B7H568_PORTR|nr:hypothetical protein [Portunus trituberculatus]
MELWCPPGSPQLSVSPTPAAVPGRAHLLAVMFPKCAGAVFRLRPVMRGAAALHTSLHSNTRKAAHAEAEIKSKLREQRSVCLYNKIHYTLFGR